MFTGIIKEIGKVRSIRKTSHGIELSVDAKIVNKNINLGDSIAVNGICLSVTKNDKCLVFDAVKNTINGTNLKRLRVASSVNLENALKMGDDLSGHMVSGHVDGEKKIINNKKTSNGWSLDIEITETDKKYLVPKGSVAIDGVSLTIGEIVSRYIRIFIIPHTLESTTLRSKKAGTYINIEFDILLKKDSPNISSGSKISMDSLHRNGFA